MTLQRPPPDILTLASECLDPSKIKILSFRLVSLALIALKKPAAPAPTTIRSNESFALSYTITGKLGSFELYLLFSKGSVRHNSKLFVEA